MPARSKASWSVATSRPTRRRTAASRSARWPRCKRPSTSSRRCLARRRRRRTKQSGKSRIEKMREESTMSLSRRRFVQTVGAGAAGLWVAGRGREAGLFDLSERAFAAETTPILLASNENPLGTPKAVLDAVRAGFGEIGRYQFATTAEIADMIAKANGVKAENVLLGSGSTQILRTTTHVFCSKTAPLVAPIPAYEECAGYAALMGYPVRTVSLTK